MVITISVLVILPLQLARYYQSAKLAETVSQYDTINTEEIILETIPLANDNLLFTNTKYFKPLGKNKLIIEEYLAVFNGDKCNYPTVWATIHYDGYTINGEMNPRMDFSRSISIDMTSKRIERFFFPAISENIAPWKKGYFTTYFAGIIISQEQSECFEGLFRVKDLSKLNILLTLNLPFDNDSSYARLRGLETDTNYTVPDKMNSRRINHILSQRIEPIKATDIKYKDLIASILYYEKDGSSSFWKVNGYAKESGRGENGGQEVMNSILSDISYKNKDALRADGDLIISKKKWHLKDSAFVARGKLHKGGVAFVILNEQRPSGIVIISKSGEFNVIIQVPQDGFYSVGLMNYVKTYNARENRMVAKVGWVENFNGK